MNTIKNREFLDKRDLLPTPSCLLVSVRISDRIFLSCKKRHLVIFIEFEKWLAIPASVGGVLARVARMACFRGWCASVGGVGGVLAWVAWEACLCGWRASVGRVGRVLAWVVRMACFVGGVLV